MSKLNRKKAPAIHTLTQIELPEAQKQTLPNGLEVLLLNNAVEEVLKIELLFLGGRWLETKPLVSRTAIYMLSEGTQTHTSAEIAERIDYFGATLKINDTLDYVSISLYTLTKYLPDLMPLLMEILLQPTFPQKELDTYIENKIQNLIVELDKNETLAYRILTENIFGTTHPYGYNSTAEAYKNITTDDLKTFWKDNFTAKNALLTISGKFSTEIVENICKEMQKLPTGEQKLPNITHHFPNTAGQIYKETKPNSLQTAVRIGQRTFNRQHPDFAGLFMLNMVLGGYFGSRLMTNIREDKGYTYGIYSSLDNLLHAGYWYIGMEVGKEVAEAAMQEILIECKKLREELIPEEELEMVRNYTMGAILTQLDGSFATMEVLRSLYIENLPNEYLSNFVNTITTITPAQLKTLAETYLQEKNFSQVIIG
jgi:predicted Zn-dependent peptidase